MNVTVTVHEDPTASVEPHWDALWKLGAPVAKAAEVTFNVTFPLLVRVTTCDAEEPSTGTVEKFNDDTLA